MLLKVYFNVPFEVMRKMYHLVITLSIFPLVKLFSTWYMAVLAAFLLVLIAYPPLVLVENTSLYKRIAVEREGGEFKRSLIIVQVSIATLIFVFWGLLGDTMEVYCRCGGHGLGFWRRRSRIGGQSIGRRRILHPRIEGTKTTKGRRRCSQGRAGDISDASDLCRPTLACEPLVALLVAPVCATVELFSNRGMDTLTVPISTGLAVLP